MNHIAALITNSNIDSRETRKEHVESIRETKKKAAIIRNADIRRIYNMIKVIGENDLHISYNR